MPIKKHIVRVQQNNNIQIPKSICDALGIGEGTSLRVYSDGNRYSFSCEVPLSYENALLLEKYKEENYSLRNKLETFKKKYNIKED